MLCISETKAENNSFSLNESQKVYFLQRCAYCVSLQQVFLLGLVLIILKKGGLLLTHSIFKKNRADLTSIHDVCMFAL